MSVGQRLGPVITITGTSLLVGCGGSGPYCGGSYGSFGSYGSYGSCGAAFYPGAAGIYEGTISSTTNPQGTATVAIIAENGEGRMAAADGSYYRLYVTTTGGSINGSFAAYSQSTALSNGAQAATGSIAGTLSANALDATLSDTTNAAQQQLAMSPDGTYLVGSSLATLAGNWTSTANGFTLTTTIQLNGSFTGTDSNNCTYNGSFSLIDPNFNAYSETHVRSCNGVNVTFNGLTAFFPGSGTGPSGTSTQLKLLSDDGAGHYLVAELE